MKKFVLAVIVLALQATVSGPLRAQETAEDPNPRPGLPNLLLSFSAELGEQAVLFVGRDASPPPGAANGGFPIEMWASIVDVSGNPLNCSSYIACPERIKLKLPPSGFLKLVVSTIEPAGSDTPYILTITGSLAPSTVPDTPIVIGDLAADSMGRVNAILNFSLILTSENEVPPVSVEVPPPVGRMMIRGLVVGSDGGTRAQSIYYWNESNRRAFYGIND